MLKSENIPEDNYAFRIFTSYKPRSKAIAKSLLSQVKQDKQINSQSSEEEVSDIEEELVAEEGEDLDSPQKGRRGTNTRSNFGVVLVLTCDRHYET